MDNKIALVIGIVALALGGWAALKPEKLGSVPGVSVFPQSVTTFTQGGGVMSTTTVGTASVLDAAQMSMNNIIRVTPAGGAGVTNVTVNTPASSTFPGIPNPGDYREWVIENAATVATTTTIGAGTGVDLQEPDGQNVVIGQNNYAFLSCYREASTDVVCRVDETIPAD